MTPVQVTRVAGGLILTGDPRRGEVRAADIHIRDGHITAVRDRDCDLARHDQRGGRGVLDATGMLVIPGMVNTHAHVWETLLRGRALDHGFPEYFAGILDRYTHLLRPGDLWLAGRLAGAEALAAGVTTVLDWCHGAWGPEHALAAARGLRDAGVRHVLAYGPPAPTSTWFDSLGPPREEQIRAVHAALRRAGGLSSMALGIRGPEFSSMDRVASDIALARELGVGVTMHAGIPGFHERVNTVTALAGVGLLGGDLTFVHSNTWSPREFAVIAETGGSVSMSPVVEAMLGLGAAPVAAAHAAGVRVSMSTDVAVTGSGDLFSQARTGLVLARASTGVVPATAGLDWVTRAAAETVELGGQAGVIAPGAFADLVVLDLSDPALVGVGVGDLAAGVVAFAHPGAVASVLVGGRVVKARGSTPGMSLAGELMEVQRRLERDAEGPR